MTIRDFVSQKFAAFGTISEADFLGMSLDGHSPDDEYSEAVGRTVGAAMAQYICEKTCAPRLTNVSENGFSMSWDFSKLGSYYLWLCRRWGLDTDKEALDALGVNIIRDKTCHW